MLRLPSAPASSATTPAVVSLATGVMVLGLKWIAYRLTGSVALYSDALESVINVVAALAMLIAVRVAARPPDAGHPYGHTKAEYFSSVLEGVLIVLAAVAIVREAWQRIATPAPITGLGAGLAVATVASVANASAAAYLVRAGARTGSPALRADGLHLWADVITSAGVLIGVSIAGLTGAWILDPVVALLVALNVVRMGTRVVRESVGGLMDEAVATGELERIRGVIEAHMTGASEIRELKTRRAGRRTFVEFHLIVPPIMTVQDAHAICDRIEEAFAANLINHRVMIHVEPSTRAGAG